MSIEAMMWVKKHAPTKNSTEMCILYALADRANDDGTGCWPYYETLADEARCSLPTVKRYVKKLEERGLIVRGDQSTVSGYPPYRRPVVWDLNMALRRGDETPEKVGYQPDTAPDRGINGDKVGYQSEQSEVSTVTDRGITVDTDNRPITPLEPSYNPPGDASAAEGAQAQPSLLPETTTPAAPSLTDEFDTWWQQVPRKKAKADARKAFKAARKKATMQQLVDGLEASMRQWQAEGREVTKIPYPATWLRAESWLDEHDQWQAPQQQQRRMWPEELYLRDMQARTPSTADHGQPWLSSPDTTPPWADTPTTEQPWLGTADEQKGISR